MATPFSPFVGRLAKPIIKRRQSQIPTDLIDWDAPEIPELEKQRIIYEDYIKEMTEDHEIETLLNEQIVRVAHETMVEEYQQKVKQYEDDAVKERSKVNLLLGQIKMFENSAQEAGDRMDELENEVNTQRNAIISLEKEKENWLEERNELLIEIENLNFRNNEITCELNHNLETYIQKNNEVEEFKKKFDGVKNQLAYYKKLAKNKDVNYD